MSIADPMKIVHKKRDDLLSKQLSAIHFDKGETGIIFFGNSLLNSALPVRHKFLIEELAEELRKNGGLKSSISAVEVTTGRISVSKLHEAVEQLIETGPAIIVIQSDIIARRVFNERQPKITERVGTWSGVLALQVFGRSQTPKKKEAGKQLFTLKRKMPHARPQQKKGKKALAIARKLWVNQRVNPNDPAFVIAREFIHRLSAKGVRVIVVEMPVSNTAATFASERYLAERSAALHSLSKAGALHFTYPRVLPDDHFRDYSHVNHHGRREFLKWFFPLLSQELVKNERSS